MALFGIGCVFWLITYIIYIKNIFKFKFVEIPFIVVCLNISWEFIWSFVFGDSVGDYLGWALQLGYALWFFFDCVIFYGLIRYGYKQFKLPFMRENAKMLAILFFIFGLIFFYTFNKAGYDTEIGTISAYLDNLVISSAYIILFMNTDNKALFSKGVAWYKMLGTGLISLSLVLHWYEKEFEPFLIFITSAVLILDIYYVILITKRKKIEEPI
jgi:hypothetical protein